MNEGIPISQRLKRDESRRMIELINQVIKSLITRLGISGRDSSLLSLPLGFIPH
jgi:hypothetical protein